MRNQIPAITASRALAALLALTTTVAAQPTPGTSTADAEFAHGRKALSSGNFAEACAAFEASQRAEAALGTQYNLAGCYTQLGKLATSLALYEDLISRDTDAARKKDSIAKAKTLRPRVPKVRITPSAAPTGIVVTIDGVDRTTVLGTDILVDLGEHTIVVKAPGYQDATQKVSVSREGAVEPVAVALSAVAVKPVETVKPTPIDLKPVDPTPIETKIDQDPQSPPSETELPMWTTRRKFAVGIGGVGLAALATGIYFWRSAVSSNDSANADCPQLECDSPDILVTARGKKDDARSSASLSTAFVIGGAAVIGTGVVLWFTGRHARESPRTALRPGSGSAALGLTLEGVF